MLKICQMPIFSRYLKFMHIFFDQVRVDYNRKHLQKFYSFERKGKLNFILNFDLSLSSFRVNAIFSYELQLMKCKIVSVFFSSQKTHRLSKHFESFIVLRSMVFDLTLKIISDIAWFLFSCI